MRATHEDQEDRPRRRRRRRGGGDEMSSGMLAVGGRTLIMIKMYIKHSDKNESQITKHETEPPERLL